MSHRSLRRHLTAGILATVLLGATPAHARGLGTAGRAWLWFQETWNRGVSVFWDRVPVTAERSGENQRKEGLGLDPNGGTTPRTNSAPAQCESCSEQGLGLDPNG